MEQSFPMKKKVNMYYSMVISFWRVLRNGIQSFYRNAWLSFATVVIITLTLTVISLLIILNLLSQNALTNLKSKIDISVYFNNDTLESDILRIQQEVEVLSEVNSTEYVSKERALHLFKERHQDDPAITESIAEIEGNPLLATLNVKAHDPEQYGVIAHFLESPKYEKHIQKINYEQNKEVIGKLTNVTKTIQKVGFIVSIIFVVIAVLVTFNTVRMTIYGYKQEIEIMRLVGASNWFIRFPFVIEGFLYGLFSAAITMGISYLAIKYFSPKVAGFLPGSDMYSYFYNHFWEMFGVLLVFGVVLGVLSSMIAVRRYLKV